MANKNLFSTKTLPVKIPPTNTVNAAGGNAYAFSDEHGLAQMAMTGMFGDTYYEDAETQLTKVLELASKVDSLYLAQLAVYARQHGYMKDMPALLCAVLTTRGAEGLTLLRKVFTQVIDNGKMLSTFIQIVRSGRVGRKSLGTSVKTTVQQWFDQRTDHQLFRDSVGMTPSMADIIKMVHPRPSNPTRQALYRYLIGKELNGEQMEVLPPLVQEFEAFKRFRLDYKTGQTKTSISAAAKKQFGTATVPVPKVPFQMLTSLGLTTEDWVQIAENGGWHFTRMNLNTFARHDVFNNNEATEVIATKLRDRDAILNSKVFPYQLFVAYKNTEVGVPNEINNALHDAMEIAIDNVPTFTQNGVAVLVDTSGSMRSARVGSRPDGTPSTIRAVDVAGLFGSAILRKNPKALVLPFDTRVHTEAIKEITSRDSVMTNTEKLARFGGGGTDCSSALAYLNQTHFKGDLVVYVSDNESWVDSRYGNRQGTEVMNQWRAYKLRNPKAKLVCIDTTPNRTSQASNDADIINIGGFSDKIFETIRDFVTPGSKGPQWVDAIKAIAI